MRTEKVTFENAQGQTLSARISLPIDQHPHTFVLFAHCFTCNKNLSAVRNISLAMSQRGFGVLRFDFTGLGESEGDFADTNFSSNVEDLVAAANMLAEKYAAPGILIGHSLGGAAVLQAAGKIDSVKAVATIGAPSNPIHVGHHFSESKEEIDAQGIATVNIGGRPFTIKKQFVDDLDGHNMEKAIKNLKRALLVMHAPFDQTVGIDNAGEIFKAAIHPKSFISLDSADHLLSDKADSVYAGSMIASWAMRYIETPEAKKISTRQEVVTRTAGESYTTEIMAGKHSLIADEPASVGGNDFGPTPYNYLTAALGACTGMTMRMYADRKGWDLQEVKVHLSHAKRHLEDCEACEASNAKLDHIDREIEIEGNLDEKQIARLMQIADRCPVHRTLHSEIVVNTTRKH